MSDSADNGVAVERKGVRMSWQNWTGYTLAILFAGGAIARFELHARHTDVRQDKTDESVKAINDKREDLSGGLREMNANLKSVSDRLDRIERKLDR